MKPLPTALLAGLVLTLALCAGLALQDDEPATVAAVEVPHRPAPPTPTPSAAAPTARRERGPWPEVDTQALAAWSAPAPPPVSPAPAPPARPPIPAFPYRWIGRLDDGQAAQALLSGPLRSFGARAGEVLDGRWRIERIAASRLELTWLPTGDTVAVELR